MNKENIIIEAYKLCEEIKGQDKHINLEVNFRFEKIQISIWDDQSSMLFLAYSYFDVQYEEKDHYVQIQNFIPTIKNYIENKSKLTV